MYLARLLTGVVFAGLLSAQIDCTATAMSLPVRAESIADRIGDIDIRCVKAPGFDPGSAYVEADVRLFMNVNTTNRLLATGADVTDAILTINGNDGTPTRTSTIDPVTRVPVPQYGVVREEFIPGSANLLIWAGVRIPIPEADRGDGTRFPLRTTIRITNVRASASQLGVSATGAATSIVIVSLASQLGSPIRITTSQARVGLLRRAFNVALRTPANSFAAIGLQCRSQGLAAGGELNATPAFHVRAEEEFAEAFRPFGVPGTGPATAAIEAGYPTPDSLGDGGANHGTRVMLRFVNVPNGVRLGVQATVLAGSVNLRLVNTDANGAGPFNPVSVGPIVPVEVSGGFGTAVYEVVAASAEAIEAVDIPVMAGYSSNTSQNLPSLGTMTISASLAPVSTVTTRSRTAPIPRFADTSVARNAFTVVPCTGEPVIQSVEPSTVPAGTAGLTFRVGGAFSQGAVIVFEGVALATRMDASGGLSADLTAAQLIRPRTARIQVRNADGSLSNVAGLIISPAAGAPAISRFGVVSAGLNEFALAPGGIASAYGSNLATTLMSASATPLPRVLAGTRVLVDEREAPLYFVSPGQINFQVPFETRLGSVPIYVSRNGVPGATEMVGVTRLAPAFLSAGERPAVVHADYQLVTEELPALPGEDLIVFGTGGGGFRNAPVSGAVSPSAPPSTTEEATETFLSAFRGALGAFPGAVTFSGLAPALVGVTQWNVRLPRVIPSGRQQFLQIWYPASRIGNGASIPVRSNSAPADQLRFTITGPATTRRGEDFTLTFNATLPGNSSGAYICTLLGSRTQPFVLAADSAFTFPIIIEAGGGAFSLPATLPANFPTGTYFLGITARDDAVSSQTPTGFAIQITN